MDFSAISALGGLSNTTQTTQVTQSLLSDVIKSNQETEKTEGTMFESFLNSAMDNLKTTNSYLSDAENEEIKFALGETENTHDLTIALQKASTALQYTVAVRDKVLEAYRELMQMQI